MGTAVLPRGTASSLARYRALAYLVGAMLIVLCVVAIPLQYAAGQPGLARVVAPIHGVLYIVYLVAAADLARRARLSLGQMIGIVAAGFVPGVAFLVERKTTALVRRSGGGRP
jgi:integral membrane protein